MLQWPASGAIITKSNVALMSGQKICLEKNFLEKGFLFFFFGGAGGGATKKVLGVQIE